VTLPKEVVAGECCLGSNRTVAFTLLLFCNASCWCRPKVRVVWVVQDAAKVVFVTPIATIIRCTDRCFDHRSSVWIVQQS
jgi:hypothetical protein